MKTRIDWNRAFQNSLRAAGTGAGHLLVATGRLTVAIGRLVQGLGRQLVLSPRASK